jgi:protein-disulfide isomerase
MSACSSSKPVPTLSPGQTALLYNPKGNVILGNPDGNVTLVEFFDYECDFCRKMFPVIQQLVKKDPNVRVIFKEYPLFGPVSEPAVRAALAAQKQNKYLAMHNALLSANEPLDHSEIIRLAKSLNLNTKKLAKDMQSPEVTNQIQENNRLAEQLNITAAPVFIFANSSVANNSQNSPAKKIMIVGEASVGKLEKLIAQVRK